MFVEHKSPGENPFSREQDAELDDASRLLLEAANMIEERGWVQRAFDRADGLCAIGAIHRTSYGVGDGLSEEAKLRVARALGHVHGYMVMSWNDTPGRTKEEVISTLRRVALTGK